MFVLISERLVLRRSERDNIKNVLWSSRKILFSQQIIAA